MPEGGRTTPPFGSRVLDVTTSISTLGPESFVSVTPLSSLRAKDLQHDFVDAIPILVYVSAGKVSIEAPGSIVFKDIAQSKHHL